jgi:CYTH domain-containing protein
MSVEREIRYRVTDGAPPPGGARLVQAYLLRGPLTLRVRLAEGRGAHMTLKLPRSDGRYEWEWPVPSALARALLRLPLPRVEKRRSREGRLEVDRLEWPAGVLLVELELEPGEGPDLRDADARRQLMESQRPAWVGSWVDVTHDPAYANASLAKVRPRRI